MAEKQAATRGGCYCRPEKKGSGRLGKTSPRVCPKCNLKIRGKNHEDGAHHKGTVRKCKRGKW